jgi:hypothetical protein
MQCDAKNAGARTWRRSRKAINGNAYCPAFSIEYANSFEELINAYCACCERATPSVYQRDFVRRNAFGRIYWRGFGCRIRDAGRPRVTASRALLDALFREKPCRNMVLQPFRWHNIFWLDTSDGRP